LTKQEQYRRDVGSVGSHPVRSEVGKDGIKITQVVDKPTLSLLYFEATDRLVVGMLPDAIDKLKEKHPKSMAATIKKLGDNYTMEGIKEFEASFVRGFRKIGMWRG
jgi:hypothetical protein